MQKNDLIRIEQSVLRVLAIDGNRALVIDCQKRNMPKWCPTESLGDDTITEQELADLSDVEIFDVDALDSVALLRDYIPVLEVAV